jgi:hypothetical protein
MMFGGNPNKSGFYHDTSVILLVVSARVFSSYTQYSNRLKGLHSQRVAQSQPLVQATWGQHGAFGQLAPTLVPWKKPYKILCCF